jgi:hypothetical protein
VIDAVAFAGFVFLASTGVLMRYVLPPGSGHFSTVWGLDRHEWGGLHFWIAICFFGTLALHLVLHWNWVVCVVTGRQREGSGFRAGLGLVGLLVLIAFSVSPLIGPVDRDTRSAGGGGILSAHKHEEVQIRGSMTLSEVEESTGVPANHIIEALGLPSSVSGEDRLGVLKRTHGFEMSDVREVVRAYRSTKR